MLSFQSYFYLYQCIFRPLSIYSRNLDFSPLDPITLTFDYDDDALSDDEVEMYPHPL